MLIFLMIDIVDDDTTGTAAKNGASRTCGLTSTKNDKL